MYGPVWMWLALEACPVMRAVRLDADQIGELGRAHLGWSLGRAARTSAPTAESHV